MESAQGSSQESEVMESPEGVEEHEWDRHQFNGPTDCGVCLRFIWGLVLQGHCCKKCYMPVHPKCKAKAALCSGPSRGDHISGLQMWQRRIAFQRKHNPLTRLVFNRARNITLGTTELSSMFGHCRLASGAALPHLEAGVITREEHFKTLSTTLSHQKRTQSMASPVSSKIKVRTLQDVLSPPMASIEPVYLGALTLNEPESPAPRQANSPDGPDRGALESLDEFGDSVVSSYDLQSFMAIPTGGPTSPSSVSGASLSVGPSTGPCVDCQSLRVHVAQARALAGQLAKAQKKITKLEKEKESLLANLQVKSRQIAFLAPQAKNSKEFIEGADGSIVFRECTYLPKDRMPPFVISAEDHFDRNYVPSHGVWMSFCSHLAYASPQCTHQVVRNLWDWHDVSFFDETTTDSHALGLVGPDFAVLAFRGTESSTNWSTNLDFKAKHPSPPLPVLSAFKEVIGSIHVHQGFETATLSLWSQIDAWIKGVVESRGEFFPIYITGHSLGGAMATLAFLFFVLCYETPQVRGIYTFGQPRVGNVALGRFFATQGPVIQRFRNKADSVPTLPPKHPHGYEHVGEELYVSKNGRICSQASRWTQRTTVLARTAATFGGAAVSDHKMSIYVECVLTHSKLVESQANAKSTFGRRARITMHFASKVAAGDVGGTSDPYCRIIAPNIPTLKTRTIPKTLNPEWEQTFQLNEVFLGDEIVVMVFDHDTFSSDEFLGMITIEVVDFINNRLADYPLLPRPGKEEADSHVEGTLTISLIFAGTTDYTSHLSSVSMTNLTSIGQASSAQESTAPSIPVFGSPAWLLCPNVADWDKDNIPVFFTKTLQFILANSLNCLAVEPSADLIDSALQSIDHDDYSPYDASDDEGVACPSLGSFLWLLWLGCNRYSPCGTGTYEDWVRTAVDAQGKPIEGRERYKRTKDCLYSLRPWQFFILQGTVLIVQLLTKNAHYTGVDLDDLLKKLTFLLFFVRDSRGHIFHIESDVELLDNIVRYLIGHSGMLFRTPFPIDLGLRQVSNPADTVLFTWSLKLAFRRIGQQASPSAISFSPSKSSKSGYVWLGTDSGKFFSFSANHKIMRYRFKLPSSPESQPPIISTILQLDSNPDHLLVVAREGPAFRFSLVDETAVPISTDGPLSNLSTGIRVIIPKTASSPAREEVWVSSVFSRIVILDASFSQIGTISTPGVCPHLLFVPSRNQVWAAAGGSLLVFSTKSRQMSEPIVLPISASSSDGSSSSSSSASMRGRMTMSLIMRTKATVQALVATNHQVFVALPTSIAVFSISSQRLLKTVDFARTITSWSLNGKYLAIAHDDVTLINHRTLQVIATASRLPTPIFLTFANSSGDLWVAAGDGAISIYQLQKTSSSSSSSSKPVKPNPRARFARLYPKKTVN